MNTIPASVRSALSRALELAAGSLVSGATSEVELGGLRVWIGWDGMRSPSRYAETVSEGVRYTAFATRSGRMGKPMASPVAAPAAEEAAAEKAAVGPAPEVTPDAEEAPFALSSLVSDPLLVSAVEALIAVRVRWTEGEEADRAFGYGPETSDASRKAYAAARKEVATRFGYFSAAEVVSLLIAALDAAGGVEDGLFGGRRTCGAEWAWTAGIDSDLL